MHRIQCIEYKRKLGEKCGDGEQIAGKQKKQKEA
jgi:hypothetical protein